tara:strand:- start:235 stop:363 length:129 start_codon:yes stop_codon:yes gene_type:complete
MSKKENKLKEFYKAFKSDVKTVATTFKNRDKDYRKYMGIKNK